MDDFYHDPKKTEKMAVIWDGVVHMATLCIAGGMAVNGVSALHSDILRRDVFRDACGMGILLQITIDTFNPHRVF